MNPQVVNYALTAADDDNIAASQSPLGAGNLTLNGVAVSNGVATLDTQRRIIITSGGDDRTVNFTITGTKLDKTPISEVLAGSNGGIAQTTQDFYTVSKIAVSAATASTVSAGTNGVGSSPWQALDVHLDVFKVSLAAVITGSVTYGIQYSYDDPNGPLQQWPIGNTVPNPIDHSTMNNLTAAAEGYLDNPCQVWRVVVLSGTGNVKATGTQQGYP